MTAPPNNRPAAFQPPLLNEWIVERGGELTISKQAIPRG
jgi:hypothetical protein